MDIPGRHRESLLQKESGSINVLLTPSLFPSLGSFIHSFILFLPSFSTLSLFFLLSLHPYHILFSFLRFWEKSLESWVCWNLSDLEVALALGHSQGA